MGDTGSLEAAVENRVLRLRLNRPSRRNALTLKLCQELLDALERAQTQAGIGCILLTGNGPAFCSGMDLEDALVADPDELADVHEKLFTIIARLRRPMVTAVHGAAVAGGVGLAANSHIVVAGPDAKFGLTEIRVGLWPVVIYRAVTRAIGDRLAAAWSLSGRIVDAQEALTAGLVTQVSDDPVAEAEKQARAIAAYSPNALAAGLEYAEQVRTLDWAASGELGKSLRIRLAAHPDFEEGVRAFKEKREPDWPSLWPERVRS